MAMMPKHTTTLITASVLRVEPKPTSSLVFLEGDHEGHDLSGHDWCEIADDGEEGVEALGLGHGGDIVGTLPKQKRNTRTPPKLANHKEQTKSPIPQQIHRRAPGSPGGRHALGQRKMKQIPTGK